MKYRFLTRIFGSERSGTMFIQDIYEKLSNVPKIRKNDQFWLQYAMSSMDIEDLEHAQSCIDTALGIAKNQGLDYSNYQIVDQHNRLRLKKNARHAGRFERDEVVKTIQSLRVSLDDSSSEDLIHPIRSSPYLLSFINVQIDELSAELRADLLSLLEAFEKKCMESRLEKTQKGEQKALEHDIKAAILVLKNA